MSGAPGVCVGTRVPRQGTASTAEGLFFGIFRNHTKPLAHLGLSYMQGAVFPPVIHEWFPVFQL